MAFTCMAGQGHYWVCLALLAAAVAATDILAYWILSIINKQAFDKDKRTICNVAHR